MIKIKFTTNKIEELFFLMNFFKTNELLRYEFKITHNDELFVLYASSVTLKESSIKNRVKNANYVIGASIQFEILNTKAFDDLSY